MLINILGTKMYEQKSIYSKSIDHIYAVEFNPPKTSSSIVKRIDEEYKKVTDVPAMIKEFDNLLDELDEAIKPIGKKLVDLRNGQIKSFKKPNFETFLKKVEATKPIADKFQKKMDKLIEVEADNQEAIDYISYKFNDVINYIYTLYYHLRKEVNKQVYIIEKELKEIKQK